MKRKTLLLMQKSLGDMLSEDEFQELQEAIKINPEMSRELQEIRKLSQLLTTQQYSFGDLFAEKIIRKIEMLEQTTAGQAMIFAFNRIALPGLVAAMILVMISLINNGSLSLDSISGVADLNPGYLSDFLLFNY